MSTTGANLLAGFSTFLDDYFASTTTSAGTTTGTTLVDTKLEKWGDDALVGWYVRITSGTNQYAVARITTNAQATGTVTVAPPFSAQVASSVTYELHAYEPAKKFAALDSARIPIADDVFKLVSDETITTDGHSLEYNIPSTIHRGPAIVYPEVSNVGPEANWNFCPDPEGNTTLTDWTASNITLSNYTRTEADILVPKFGDQCTKAVVAAAVAGTLTLPAANMDNGITAAKAAGRRMTFAAWIFCRTASAVTISILDDSGTAGTSSTHQGKGWEFLYVTANIVATNATTLSLRISESSSAGVVFFVNNHFFYYGEFEQVNNQYYRTTPARARRDDTNKKFILVEKIPARKQLRLVGKGILTALGTNTTTQVTNSMEVDETTAELLYAYAAEILFQGERLSATQFPQVLNRIQSARDRLPKIRMNWDMELTPQRFVSPYQR